jgi:SAM-dependent methyltransferase
VWGVRVGLKQDSLYRYMVAKWVYGYSLPLEILSRLGVRKGSLLVLFGSGMGLTAFLAAKRFGCYVVGVEKNHFLVQYSKRKAGKENMVDRVTFVHIDDKEFLSETNPEFVFYESILNFLQNPSDILTRYVSSAERIGVLELSWLRHNVPNDKREALKSIFGGDASFMHVDAWLKLFHVIRLEVLEGGVRTIGLVNKFWDDLRVEPLGTITGIVKTAYKTFTDLTARKYMTSFINFLRQYSNDMACAYYILRPLS